MQRGVGQAREEVVAALRAEAERAWGAERAAALSEAIETTGTALWRLAQAPLELLEAEPAFIGPSIGGES